MPQRNVATNFTFEQQRLEINLLAQDFWTQKTNVDNAASTYLKHDGTNSFTGGTLAVPNAFTINSNSGNGTVTIAGNLQVDGTTTTVNTATMDVVDKNITIAKGSANDAAADGAGITIDSATDITFNFVDAKDSLVSSIGLEATTFLKAPYGQFIGSGVPTGGQGVEINAPDTNTGQIISYDRANTAYKELRVKGSSVGVYTGTTNALVGSFNSTGLSMESGKTITSGNITISTDTDASFFINTTNANGSHLRLQKSGTSKSFIGQAAGIAGTLGGADDFAIRSAGDIALSTNDNNTVNFLLDTNGNVNFGAKKTVAFPSGTGIQVHHSSNPRIKLTNDTTGNGATDGTQIYLSTDGDTIIDNKDGEDIIFHTNAVEKFRIKNTATGSFVSVGNSTTNSSISAAFQVIAADGEADELYVGKFHNLEATAGHSFGVNIQAGSSTDDHGFRVKNRANDATHLIVRGDGNIGINESSPDNKLHITTTSSVAYDTNTSNTQNQTNALLKLENLDGADGGGVNNYVGIQFAVGSGATSHSQFNYVRTGDNSGRFAFKARNGNGTVYPNLMDITSDGRVGIGHHSYSQITHELTIRPANDGGISIKRPGDTVSSPNTHLDITTTTAGSAFPSGEAYTVKYKTNNSDQIFETYAGGGTGGNISFRTSTSNTSSESLRITPTRQVLPGTDNTQDLGSPTMRWANLYTGDINLCNEGSYNEVDGTSGSWTMQEGDSDLFLINRKSGKKYKFNLTEVA